jgi:hypothetical protein
VSTTYAVNGRPITVDDFQSTSVAVQNTGTEVLFIEPLGRQVPAGQTVTVPGWSTRRTRVRTAGQNGTAVVTLTAGTPAAGPGPGGVTFDPGPAASVSLSISGGTWYSNEGLTTAVSFPVSLVAPTVLYPAAAGSITVTAVVGGTTQVRGMNVNEGSAEGFTWVPSTDAERAAAGVSAGTGTYGPTAVQMLAAFGPSIIAATGVAATDNAAIQAAHDALPAAGGDIRLGAGTFVITGLSITKPTRLRGAGTTNGPISVAFGNSAAGLTIIQCASATANAITITADACKFQDFALINTNGTAPTAGAGFLVSSGGACIRWENVTVGGFYRNWDIATGYEQYMNSCVSYDFVKTGLRIRDTTLPDGGDLGVSNCQFLAGPTNLAPQSAIEWCSAGGLRLVGCKVNKRGSANPVIGLFLHPDDGITTSVIVVSGCSFENYQYCIYSDDTGNTGTGNLSKVVIVGNEMLGTVKQIAFSRTAAGHLQDVVITGNEFSSPTATVGVTLGNLLNVRLTDNVFAPTITSPLTINSGVTSLFLDGMAFTTAARPAATIMLNGSWYYDKTLSKPAWSDGTTWRDAAGTSV